MNRSAVSHEGCTHTVLVNTVKNPSLRSYRGLQALVRVRLKEVLTWGT